MTNEQTAKLLVTLLRTCGFDLQLGDGTVPPQKLAYSEPEAAELLSISPRKLFDVRKTGTIDYKQEGTRISYPIECLIDYLRQTANGGA